MHTQNMGEDKAQAQIQASSPMTMWRQHNPFQVGDSAVVISLLLFGEKVTWNIAH